ncbi:MAG: metal-dependent transcriptional regulator [Clostridia bacterium]|nr:metal-dependent transcriptional regulator [Clostridia bacterium]
MKRRFILKKLHRSGEDYLETVLILQKKNGSVRSSDVADYLKVTRPSVSRAISILKDGGLLLMNDDKTLTLTEIGSDVAEHVYEKHCVLKDRLVSLGVDPKIAEQDACGIEHIISYESFEKIKALWMKPVTGD